MKIDLGFWDKDGNYIEDIQEVSEEELSEAKDESSQTRTTRYDSFFE